MCIMCIAVAVAVMMMVVARTDLDGVNLEPAEPAPPEHIVR